MVYSFEVDDWKYITRASGAEKMAGNEKTGPEHDGRIIHKHTHTHPIPFLHPISISSFFAYPTLITQTHRCTHAHIHTHTHACAHRHDNQNAYKALVVCPPFVQVVQTLLGRRS